MDVLTIDFRSDDNLLTVTATGHATLVMEEFHALAKIVLQGKGPWKIDYVEGRHTYEEGKVDSDMLWTLTASSKNRQVR